jgi:hypothetical protein
VYRGRGLSRLSAGCRNARRTCPPGLSIVELQRFAATQSGAEAATQPSQNGSCWRDLQSGAHDGAQSRKRRTRWKCRPTGKRGQPKAGFAFRRGGNRWRDSHDSHRARTGTHSVSCVSAKRIEVHVCRKGITIAFKPSAFNNIHVIDTTITPSRNAQHRECDEVLRYRNHTHVSDLIDFL